MIATNACKRLVQVHSCMCPVQCVASIVLWLWHLLLGVVLCACMCQWHGFACLLLRECLAGTRWHNACLPRGFDS